MHNRKGIILAGGLGTRLYPCTKYVCKQLLPVYNKPMIHYPLYTLLSMGIKDILIISTPETTPILERELGDCHEYGANVSYAIQPKPEGIAQAYIIAKDFLNGSPSCLILGDNIFYGDECQRAFRDYYMCSDYNTIIGYHVSDPSRYGVVEMDGNGRIASIVEKPQHPKSNIAITGIYFFDGDVVNIAESLKPSDRGELEITDIIREYLHQGMLSCHVLGVGNAYLDTGTFESLNDASNFIRMMEERTGLRISDLEKFKMENKKYVVDSDFSDLGSGLIENSVFYIDLPFFVDSRGFFREMWNEGTLPGRFSKLDWVKQMNMSVSHEHVFRGMHMQSNGHEQGKLVCCTSGEVIDVIVDMRPNSPTYKNLKTYLLNPCNGRMLWVPKGFLHGFLSLRNDSVFMYMCDEVYDKASECGANVNSVLSEDNGITMHIDDYHVPFLSDKFILSFKDDALPEISDFEKTIIKTNKNI